MSASHMEGQLNACVNQAKTLRHEAASLDEWFTNGRKAYVRDRKPRDEAAKCASVEEHFARELFWLVERSSAPDGTPVCATSTIEMGDCGRSLKTCPNLETPELSFITLLQAHTQDVRPPVAASLHPRDLCQHNAIYMWSQERKCTVHSLSASAVCLARGSGVSSSSGELASAHLSLHIRYR